MRGMDGGSYDEVGEDAESVDKISELEEKIKILEDRDVVMAPSGFNGYGSQARVEVSQESVEEKLLSINLGTYHFQHSVFMTSLQQEVVKTIRSTWVNQGDTIVSSLYQIILDTMVMNKHLLTPPEPTELEKLRRKVQDFTLLN